MVVAEIPLWLVHAGEAGGANGIIGNPSSDAFAELPETKEGQAQSSLGLLQNSGRGKKCAVYSIDINAAGNRIATCGGDGTVRLWSVSSLFSRKRSRFSDEGKYESSEASEDSGPGDNDDNETSNKMGENASKDPINSTITEAEGGDGSAEGDARENMVHDLSSLVRRKKGGELIQSSAKPAASATHQPQPSQHKQQTSPSRQTCQKHQRLLCTLSAHTGSSVLAVRFSHNGRFLASAGDDAAVCIYTKDSGGGAIGNLTDQSSEPWSRIKLCRGHGLDVVGLAWAPDDSHLVSCSLDSDSPIIVWKLTDLSGMAWEGRHHFPHSNALCNPYKILGKGVHTSTVKGVTFDPAGTYLASSGDDPAVCIWRAHDDWGLERRIDASSGIFRRWKEDNSQSLSSQTLFRRLSWSTDGAFICSTNCVVKNKHVASTISRDGWNVSTARSAAAGAANLVGHKQPVVVSRHCSKLLASKNKHENGESGNSSNSDGDGDGEDEPSYATLLALGDRHGFVTVWSTRKSRPIFKLQCSETRCTVTDLAWGKVRDDAIILLVSLLDGQCVALRFKIPEEVGPLLPNKDHARLFKFRYGIDVDDAGDFSRRRLFVGDSSGPKFIENALQMSLENRLGDQKAEESDIEMNDASPPLDNATEPMQLSTNAASVKAQQDESQSKGKKRIRPVLMSVDDDAGKHKKPTANMARGMDGQTSEDKKETDPLRSASELTEKAASVSNSVPQLKRDAPTTDATPREDTAPPVQASAQSPRNLALPGIMDVANAPLQYNTNRTQSVDLPFASGDRKELKKAVATCTNSFSVPLGSKGPSAQCIDVSISTEGSESWRDQIVGTSCSAVAAANNALAVGTADGAIQLYGTSPSLGWECGTAFRSHPLLVLGHPIVALQLHEPPEARGSPKAELEMLVVTADGTFGVYQILPKLRVINKGSIMPAMTHMALGMGLNSNESRQPRLSRIQLTDSNQVLLLLSLSDAASRSTLDTHAPRNVQRQHGGSSLGGAYGSIQAFVYNMPLELWMRISDGRFVLSDFYSTLPNEKSSSRAGVLARLDDSVRTGALESSMTPSLRRRANAASDQSGDIYQHSEEKANSLATRSHCEDRMACALALGSSSEFKQWLSLYVRALSLGGHTDLLRVLVDMLLGVSSKSTENGNHLPMQSNSNGDICWWLSSTPQTLNIDRKSLIRNVVIAEMSKNRTLQRLTNEISLELDSLPPT